MAVNRVRHRFLCNNNSYKFVSASFVFNSTIKVVTFLFGYAGALFSCNRVT